MALSWCKIAACLAVLAMSGLWTAQLQAADPYKLNVLGVANTAPGNFPTVTFEVVTNTATPQRVDLASDPRWTMACPVPPGAPCGALARLALHVGWDTRDFNNTNSTTNLPSPTGAPYAKGAAYPIPINAVTNGKLAPSLTHNADGTYSATAPLPIAATVTGTGRAIMEGHPSQWDPATGLFVAIPIRSAFKSFVITGSFLERREVVDVNKCMVCHYVGGPGGRLTLHGENRTEEVRVCQVCHNPNQTDVQRREASDVTNYPVRIGGETYYEQSVDFKRLVHGIHATTAGFRQYPLVIIGPQFDAARCQIEGPCTADYRFLFDASRLKEFPAKLRNCLNCHIDNGTKGTFELPLASTVLASTAKTLSFLGATPAGTVVDADPTNDENITPTAAVCSSCHDKADVVSHMINTGGANFHVTQGAIDSGSVKEKCFDCHGPGKDKSVRKVHIGDDD